MVMCESVCGCAGWVLSGPHAGSGVDSGGGHGFASERGPEVWEQLGADAVCVDDSVSVRIRGAHARGMCSDGPSVCADGGGIRSASGDGVSSVARSPGGPAGSDQSRRTFAGTSCAGQLPVRRD